MGTKVFLDANVILDAYLHRENDAADQIMELVSDSKIDAKITSSVLHICSYWIKKEYGASETKRLLIQLLSYVQVIDLSHHNAVFALHSLIADVEDALQYFAAIQHNLDCFISSDKQLAKNAIETLPVYAPLQFIRMFQKEM